MKDMLNLNKEGKDWKRTLLARTETHFMALKIYFDIVNKNLHYSNLNIIIDLIQEKWFLSVWLKVFQELDNITDPYMTSYSDILQLIYQSDRWPWTNWRYYDITYKAGNSGMIQEPPTSNIFTYADDWITVTGIKE
jgi:hypothetical protein